MARPRRKGRPPAQPGTGDPTGMLPSDRLTKSVTVKLDPEERMLLGRCRRLIAGPEGDAFPTSSHVLRLALGALYHSLTGHPPEGGGDGPK